MQNRMAVNNALIDLIKKGTHNQLKVTHCSWIKRGSHQIQGTFLIFSSEVVNFPTNSGCLVATERAGCIIRQSTVLLLHVGHNQTMTLA
jgi:hypothetical protein